MAAQTVTMTHCTIQKNNIPLHYPYVFEAARNLAGGAFKLYIYLYSFTSELLNYDRTQAEETLGLSRYTLNNAFAELVLANYLRKDAEGIYFFSATPLEKN